VPDLYGPTYFAVTSIPIAVDDFAALAGARLHGEAPSWTDPTSNPPDLRGDHSMDLDPTPPAFDGPPRPAAVLVPIVAHATDATLLLTQRTAFLRDHSGQIAFPGGRVDPTDASPLAAALREAEEEVGLDPALVRPLGFLDAYLSGSGFLVMPVVGLLSPGFSLALNPSEVDDSFEVPLGFLMDPRRHELHTRVWKGQQRRYYAIPFGDRYIWGVTAGIIRNLYEKLYGG
jgi:8-oxo-dGTP pyrophosphatase MutT (NUDIX family)